MTPTSGEEEFILGPNTNDCGPGTQFLFQEKTFNTELFIASSFGEKAKETQT